MAKSSFNGLSFSELKDFLDEKAEQFNNPNFIETDPIQIPHRFSKKEDIEISAFLISTIAWGNRQAIIKSGEKLIKLMGESPFDFVMNYRSGEKLDFVHRTFNSVDLDYFILALQNLYATGGLEGAFLRGGKGGIIHFRERFFSLNHELRTGKHVANPLKGSSAKRINMFLRWMSRKDNRGVDFGIWNLPMSNLYLPLDVHTGNISRKLGMLRRTQDDWRAVEELQEILIQLDPNDPCKYDFALFGLGAFENF